MTGECATCPATRWLSIVGIGEDGTAGLSDVARRLVSSAELVLGGKRHLALAEGLIKGRPMAWPSPISNVLPEIEKHRGRSVVVLASGDPFHHGVGDMLMRAFPVEETLCLPQPSSFSLAASRLGWSLQDVASISLHGRALENIVRYLQPGTRVLALSWDATTPATLARFLVERGMGSSKLTVLERLGGPQERVRSTTASTFELADVVALNIIALDVVAPAGAKVLPLATGLDDALFEHDGQLTKREIRAITISSLAPCQGELLWDVGLGAGSVAIEWLLRHPAMRAIGIEENTVRAARAARNAAALGAPDLRIIEKAAPAAFEGLPVPDAIFVGGGLSDPDLLDTAWAALRPGGRIVANAVSLASEARLIECFQKHGGEITRLQVDRTGRAGSGNVVVWRPAAPVIQWRARKP